MKRIINKVKPINPKELDSSPAIPDEIISIFNKLIIEKWNGKEAVVFQDNVIDRILEEAPHLNLTKKEIFERNYLDIEKMFRKEGWFVQYESPSIGDNDFAPHWTFINII